MYLDIHTHIDSESTTTAKIISLDLGQPLPSHTSLFTLGIHPWSLKEDDKLSDRIQELKKVVVQHRPLAMGEMGLDRSGKGPSLEVQQQFFIAQLKLAQELNYTCVIVHCVRAYSDFIFCLNQSGYLGNVILHDYNGNPEQTTQLLKYNCYFSYSRSLIYKQTKGFQSLQKVPLTRLFIETDDQQEHSIEELYRKMSLEKNISISDLQKQVLINFHSCFGKPFSKNETTHP